MKYDVTTSHMYTQHWIVEYVSNKLNMGLVTIPDAKIMSIEPFEEEGLDEPQIDTISYGGTDPE